MDNQPNTTENQLTCLCENGCKNIARCCFCNKKICKESGISGKCDSPGFSKIIGDIQVKACIECHEKKVDEILNKK